MRRVTVVIEDEEKAGLAEWARREYRHPRDQLRLILRDALQRQGLLPSSEPECTDVRAKEAARAAP
jgi:hypothetical protein